MSLSQADLVYRIDVFRKEGVKSLSELEYCRAGRRGRVEQRPVKLLVLYSLADPTVGVQKSLTEMDVWAIVVWALYVFLVVAITIWLAKYLVEKGLKQDWNSMSLGKKILAYLLVAIFFPLALLAAGVLAIMSPE